MRAKLHSPHFGLEEYKEETFRQTGTSEVMVEFIPKTDMEQDVDELDEMFRTIICQGQGT